MQCGTARNRRISDHRVMTFEQRKAVVVSFWMLLVVTIAVVLAVNTPAGWGIIGLIAVIPSTIVMRLWTPPAAAIPQQIHGGQR